MKNFCCNNLLQTFYSIVVLLSVRYKAKNHTDWSLGCEPEFTLSCNATESSFIKLPNVEFYGYDINSYDNYTLERCEEVIICLQNCKCTGFIFPYRSESGFYSCYPKSLLLNGSRSPAFWAPFYVRLPKASLTSYANRKQEIGLHCPPTTQNLLLDRAYKKPKENGTLQFMVWFAFALGGFEIICICFVWLLLYKTQQSSSENAKGYLQVVSKVADFGLSKLLNRGGGGKSLSFSRVRGTRGYMAPEWISNLPITSKVDVYSYGMVVLEMVTGKSPMTTVVQGSGNTEEMEQRGLVKWVMEKMNGNGENELWLEKIIDPIMKGKCDLRKMGILVQVALECVEEDKNARPTKSQRGLVKWVREKMNGNGENELWLEEIIDPVMKGKCDLRKMRILVQVALECVKEDKDARPTMSQVIERLLPH
ncbi:hypothetical protein RHGRI_016311 [Rhododendron griersonianum]|uniref:Protein kinase domain-containing protein n=1 Tax=Rhododendron griersonianum TaxID=479676 RepID=A0AAV6JTQ1_9ERIC|nr:hypothetical protein RHGRI_016311 [Rhododendron griersonianum]